MVFEVHTNRTDNRRLNGTVRLTKSGLNKCDNLFMRQYMNTLRVRKESMYKFDTLLSQKYIQRSEYANLQVWVKENSGINIKKAPKGRIKKDFVRRAQMSFSNRVADEAQYVIDQAIIALSSLFEEYIKRVFEKYYVDNPMRIPDNKKISTNVALGSDIYGYEDVMKSISKEIVRDLMRESTSKWMLCTSAKFNIDWKQYGQLESNIIELYLLRNCVIHNARFVTRDLAQHKNKYIGFLKVTATQNDYTRFKNSIKKAMEIIRVGYESVSISVIQQNKGTAQKLIIAMSPSEKKRTNMTAVQMDILALQYKNMSLKEIRKLLFDYKNDENSIVAAKILKLQFSNPTNTTKNAVFIFCLLNINLFTNRRAIRMISHNILTGRRVAGHNPSLIGHYSQSSSPYTLYFCLLLLCDYAGFGKSNYIRWAISNIDKGIFFIDDPNVRSSLRKLISSAKKELDIHVKNTSKVEHSEDILS